MKRNLNFLRRKILKVKLKSPPVRNLYKKFDQAISPAGRTKLDGIVKSLREMPDLNAKNFHQTVEKEGKKIFPQLKVEEIDVVTFLVIQRWEEELKKAGDDGQLANIDLQNALQKQQQTIQMLSNVSKMLHDTSMAIIRKIG
ncbi:MAG: hypothetical protein ACTSRE_11350 [Promethearchaeota archaeon]